jgi:hypothetical protein
VVRLRVMVLSPVGLPARSVVLVLPTRFYQQI